MSGQSFRHHLLAAFVSLLMSSIAVGAAIAPSQVVAAPTHTEIVSYA